MGQKKAEFGAGGNLPARITVAGYLHSFIHPPVAIKPSRGGSSELHDDSISDDDTDTSADINFSRTSDLTDKVKARYDKAKPEVKNTIDYLRMKLQDKFYPW